MFEKSLFRSAAGAFAAALLAATAHADSITHGGTTVTMDFVTVGDPGNAGEQSRLDRGDTTYYGGVDYAFNIGKYEVSQNQWDAVSGIPGDLLNDAGSWFGDWPAASISWNEAAMFCNWLTSGDVTQGAYTINSSGVVTGIDREGAVSTHATVYVIPTLNEWYKAAYYDGDVGTYYNYPTGSDAWPDGLDYDGDPTFDAVFSDPYDQGHPNAVNNAGILSPYGTMGQGGNVWEWNETLIFDIEGHPNRGIRGGYWNYSDSRIYMRSDVEHYGDPTLEGHTLGFRVASIPEPGGITLLVSASVAGLIWWRRKGA